MTQLKGFFVACLLTLFCASAPVSAVEGVTGTEAVIAEVEAAVNINTANAETLASQLKGVGMKRAQAIVDYRETHGAFTDILQLLEVKGVGQVIVEQNRHRISL